MVEKEERIYIGFINPEGDACPVPYGKCNSLCDNCQGGMTRTEAINRIEKVMEEGWWSGKTFRQIAEAALNALLEGK